MKKGLELNPKEIQKDYELVHAWDGEEAVELHQKFHPHVVLSLIHIYRETSKYTESRSIVWKRDFFL